MRPVLIFVASEFAGTESLFTGLLCKEPTAPETQGMMALWEDLGGLGTEGQSEHS